MRGVKPWETERWLVLELAERGLLLWEHLAKRKITKYQRMRIKWLVVGRCKELGVEAEVVGSELIRLQDRFHIVLNRWPRVVISYDDEEVIFNVSKLGRFLDSLDGEPDTWEQIKQRLAVTERT